MNRVMVIPAAGRGARLGSAEPKPLVAVNGRPMLDLVIERYRHVVSTYLIVTSPGALTRIGDHCAGRPERIELWTQEVPTGMLDAMLTPLARVRELAPAEVWVTWCDQVAIHAETVRRLAEVMASSQQPALTLPTVLLEAPYIHFARDGGGRITEVKQRREGDVMPDRGEADLGLFALSLEAYTAQLPLFAAVATPGQQTRERNFLPFIPWLAARAEVRTVPAESPMEAVGINTPEELRRVAAHLAGLHPHD